MLSRRGQRRPARRQHPCVAPLDDPLHQSTGRLQNMLAVVQDDQRVSVGQVVDEAVHEVHPWLRASAYGLGDRAHDGSLVRDRGQLSTARRHLDTWAAAYGR